MPILQSRLLRLLEAAETYQMLYDHAINVIYHEAARAKSGEQSWEQAFSAVSLDISHAVMRGADVVLNEERWRYKLTFRKNDKVKKKKQGKRQQQGAALRATSTVPKRTAQQIQASLEREEQELENAAAPIPDEDSQLTDEQYLAAFNKTIPEGERARLEKEADMAGQWLPAKVPVKDVPPAKDDDSGE